MAARFPSAALLLPALLLCASALAGEIPAVDLDSPDTRYPYRMILDLNISVPSGQHSGSGPTAATIDIDGDGRPEYLHSTKNGLLCESWTDGSPVAGWQVNLPPAFNQGNQTVHICEIGDVDGNGGPDQSLLGQRDDPRRWRLWILDPREAKILAEHELPLGPDNRPDGHWDGRYRVLGSTPHPGAAGGRALILLSDVGYDLEPRGISALDPLSGREIWNHAMGCNPALEGCLLTDLDGDGRAEVVVVGNAPDNLGGRTVNGTSDDMLHVIVLDSGGELLWRRRICPAFARGYAVAADVDGDGRPEVCVSVDCSGDRGGVYVFSAAGDSLHYCPVARTVRGMAALPSPGGGGDMLYVGTRLGEIRRLRLIDGELAEDLRARTDGLVEVLFGADILPEPGTELLVSSAPGDHYVLGADLRPLARQTDDSLLLGLQGDCVVWEVQPGDSRLLVLGDDRSIGRAFRFEPAEPEPADLRWLLLAVFPAGAAAVAVFRRRVRNGVRPEEDPEVLRELRLRLLDNLELSNHGAIGALRSLRRTAWLCEAASSDPDRYADLKPRLEETWSDCRDRALPVQRANLQLAGRAGIDPDLVGNLDRALKAVSSALESLAGRGFPPEKTREAGAELSALSAATEAAAQDLRTAVGAYFRADVGAAVDRILLARRDEIDRAGVRVARTVRSGKGPWCRIDPGELAFVLENLVANALRALDGASVREIAVEWEEADNMVRIRVRDTGCGIRPEDRRRIMESRASDRPGGGLGLPRSVEILRKYGASLAVESGEPGSGATFLLSVPAAGPAVED